MELKPMHAYLLSLGGKQVFDKWDELAERFGYTNGQVASTSWQHFKRTKRGLQLLREHKESLVLTKESRNAKGEVTSQTFKLKENNPTKFDFTEDQVIGGTTNPHGSDWLRFINSKTYGLAEYQVDQLAEQLSGKIKIPKLAKSSKIGIADVSDLHAGGVLKYMSETIKAKEFNTDILINYLAEAAATINKYKFAEVHLMIPGDIIETFTAFNHQDTWKHVSSHAGGITKIIYSILKTFFQLIRNLKVVYMVEGNHDRITKAKEGNSRRGVVDVVSFFLQENCTEIEVNYHPWMVSKEIDGINHMMSHGDFKAYKKHDFWFRYGRQGMYNVYRTGHLHGFNVLRHTHENLHYQCPSLFTGNFFSESIGYDSVPAITILENENGLPKLHYEPLVNPY